MNDLEKVTDLDFGQLSTHDTPSGEESENSAEGLPIEDENGIKF